MFGFLAPVSAKLHRFWALVARRPWHFAAALLGLMAVAALLQRPIPVVILGAFLAILLMWKSESHAAALPPRKYP